MKYSIISKEEFGKVEETEENQRDYLLALCHRAYITGVQLYLDLSKSVCVGKFLDTKEVPKFDALLSYLKDGTLISYEEVGDKENLKAFMLSITEHSLVEGMRQKAFESAKEKAHSDNLNLSTFEVESLACSIMYWDDCLIYAISSVSVCKDDKGVDKVLLYAHATDIEPNEEFEPALQRAVSRTTVVLSSKIR